MVVSRKTRSCEGRANATQCAHSYSLTTVQRLPNSSKAATMAVASREGMVRHLLSRVEATALLLLNRVATVHKAAATVLPTVRPLRSKVEDTAAAADQPILANSSNDRKRSPNLPDHHLVPTRNSGPGSSQ